jgi:hypothetical protein
MESVVSEQAGQVWERRERGTGGLGLVCEVSSAKEGGMAWNDGSKEGKEIAYHREFFKLFAIFIFERANV